MLELRHLRTLTALREYDSLAAAAHALCITPSAVSHQLKELEHFYGTEIVQRRSRPLTFSPVGERLLLLADDVLPACQTAQMDIAALQQGQTGRMILSSECHSCFDWLMPVLNQYQKKYPDVELDFVSGFEAAPHTQLCNEECDLLITADPIELEGITYFSIFDYECRLVLAPTHPFCRMSDITLDELCQETLIAYPVEKHRLDIMARLFIPAHRQPRRIRTTDSSQMLIQLVASHQGIAALPDWVVADYEQKGWVTSRRLYAVGPDGLRRTLYAGYRKTDQDKTYFRGFLDHLRQFARHRPVLYEA